MTFQDFMDQLVLKCGNREKHREMLQFFAYTAIEEAEGDVFHPWFLLVENDVEFLSGVDKGQLPAGYIAAHEESELRWTDSNGNFGCLKKVLTEEIQCAIPAQGCPTCYSITGHTIRLYPVPVNDTVVHIIHYGKPVEEPEPEPVVELYGTVENVIDQAQVGDTISWMMFSQETPL